MGRVLAFHLTVDGPSTGRVLSGGNLKLQAHGNVLAAVGAPAWVTAGDVTPEELDEHDSAYDVIVGVHATKHDPGPGSRASNRISY